MQLFLATAALFAGLTLAQDLSQINSLPDCGVRLLHLAPDVNLTSSMADNNMITENMHQQHAG